MLSSAIEDDQFRHVDFVGILKSLFAADIRFLDTLLDICHVEKDGHLEGVAVASGLSPAQSHISFHNLERLDFFTPAGRRLKGFAFEFPQTCCRNSDGLIPKKAPNAILMREADGVFWWILGDMV